MRNKRTRIQRNHEKIGVIQTHIKNNLRNYIIVTIIFLCGIILGVLFINNANEVQGEEISNYINEFVGKTKDNASIDYIKLFISSIKNNLSFALLLWFSGLTVIGVFVVYGAVCFKGFCIGYSAASAIATLGIKNGSIFIFSSMLLQNLILIPTIFALSISRYKAI